MRTNYYQCHQAIPLPNGIFITMIQVGMAAEPNSQNTFSMLENLDSRGAAYNAFFGIPFSRVRREGLGRDLLEGLRPNVNSNAHTVAGSSVQSTGSQNKSFGAGSQQLFGDHKTETNKSAKATAQRSPATITASQKKVEASTARLKRAPASRNLTQPRMHLIQTCR